MGRATCDERGGLTHKGYHRVAAFIRSSEAGRLHKDRRYKVLPIQS